MTAPAAETNALLRRTLRAAAAAAVFLATAALYVLSRGKWSDPIVDSGREWIVPDALARGELLYRDVVYWFGPFTPYAHAAFFRLFGSSLATLVLAGGIAAAAILAALFFALKTVTGRREALLWTAVAIPVLVFMPNAGGPLLGMGYRIWHAAGFSLVAIGLSARASGARRGWLLAGAGALAALSALCRFEWGLVALGAAALCRLTRAGSPKRAVLDLAPLTLAFGAVFGASLGVFVALAGEQAVIRDGHVLLTGLPAETRTFLLAFSGIADWRRGLVQMVYSAAMWTGAAAVVHLAARPRPASQAVRLLLPIVAVLALTAALGGASGAVLFSAAPLICAGATLAGLARRRTFSGSATLAFGLAGLILSYRRPFHIGDSAYVGPPLLFAFVSAAALLRGTVLRLREGRFRTRLSGAFQFSLAILAVAAFAGRALQYASDDRVPIPGTNAMLSARPSVARTFSDLARAVRAGSKPGDGLVAFPEGELVNLLTGLRNPIRHKLYLPGYLSSNNEDAILRELEAARPRVVVIWRRPTSEYGPAIFQEDYGIRIGAWIDRHYALAPFPRPARSRGDRASAHRVLERRPTVMHLSSFLGHPNVYRLWQAPFAGQKLEPLRRRGELSNARSVLDVGCGPGINTSQFRRAPRYLGLDLNPEYIEFARRRFGREFAVTDVRKYTAPEGMKYDFILLNSFLHHIDTESARRILAHLATLLTPEGHVYILDLVLPEARGIPRALALRDRGDYPRPLLQWQALFEESFEPVSFEPFPLRLLGLTLWKMVYFKGRARR